MAIASPTTIVTAAAPCRGTRFVSGSRRAPPPKRADDSDTQRDERETGLRPSPC